jgi:hypothetical protein
MRLPNAEHAVVDLRKLRDYCRNFDHPVGKHEARVFLEVLGWTMEMQLPCVTPCSARLLCARQSTGARMSTALGTKWVPT